MFTWNGNENKAMQQFTYKICLMQNLTHTQPDQASMCNSFKPVLDGYMMPNQQQHHKESAISAAANVLKSLLTSWMASSANWNVSMWNRLVPHAFAGIKIHYFIAVDFFLWMKWFIQVSSASKYVHSMAKGCCRVKISKWRWFSLNAANDSIINCKKTIFGDGHLGINNCFNSVTIPTMKPQSLITFITNIPMW